MSCDVSTPAPAYRLITDDHTAVGSAAAHFRTVRGEPADLLFFQQALVSQKLACKQDALSAKSGDQNLICHGLALLLFRALIPVNTQRIIGDHLLIHPLQRLGGGHAPVGGAGGDDFHQREYKYTVFS